MEMTLNDRLIAEPEQIDLEARNSIRRWTAAAAVSITVTIITASLGLLLPLLPYIIEVPVADQLSRFDSILIAAVFPLLILTAHCLDKIDDSDKKARTAKFDEGPSNETRNKNFVVMALLVFSSLFALPLAANAQQTIFNVPTTDVLESGKVYVELDAAFKTVDQSALGKFSSFVPRVVVGVGRDVEVGLNVTGNVQPGTDTTTLVPTVKWRFYRNTKSKIDLIAGTNLYIPVRRRAYNLGAYSYLAGSKTIGMTRLSAGAFVASKNVFAANAVRGGGQFGFEQTVNDKFTIAADWVTGRHASGYFTPGVIYKPHPRVTTYWSYSIGNSDASKGNHFFLFEVGYNF